MGTFANSPSAKAEGWAALMLRVGVGLVFVIGGAAKLSKLLGEPASRDALVSSYTGTSGYINQFFLDYLFTGRFGDFLSPSLFLTTLSWFELLSGLMLIAGLAVRPLSLIYGFLVWSFVMALPVVTVPGLSTEISTYRSPAMLVQIRDIGLSGMMFTLFNLGAGAFSLDRRYRLEDPQRPIASWDCLGLLLRLSVAVILLVGGAFAGFDHIQSFATAGWILLLLGVVLAGGTGARVAGALTVAVMAWYMIGKVSLAKSLLDNLNGIKREFAIGAAAGVLAWLGGGHAFTFEGVAARLRTRRPAQAS